MEKRCIFNVPSLTEGKVKIRNYKSPHSSPVMNMTRIHRSNSIVFENVPSAKPKHRSRNSVDIDKIPSQMFTKKDLDQRNEKIRLRKDLLEGVKMSSNDIDSLIQVKSLENRILRENVEAFVASVKDEETERLRVRYKEEDLLIASLRSKILKKTEFGELQVHRVQLDEIQKLVKQNEELRSEIKEMKNKMKKYGNSSLGPKKTQSFKDKLISLESKYESSLTENSHLQHSLIALKKQNLSSSQSTTFTPTLKSILTDIQKLLYLVKHYYEHQTIDFSKFLTENFYVSCDSSAEYLEKIKKTLEVLRLLSTDLYAEHCGSACYTQ